MLRIPWSCCFTFGNSCKCRQRSDFLFKRYDCRSLLTNLNLNFQVSFVCVELSINGSFLFQQSQGLLRLKQQLKTNISIVNFAQITSIFLVLNDKVLRGQKETEYLKIIALTKVLSKNGIYEKYIYIYEKYYV